MSGILFWQDVEGKLWVQSYNLEGTINYEYEKRFMLWTPIVRVPKGKTIHNQMRDIEEIVFNVKMAYGVDLDCIINNRFLDCLNELRAFARLRTENLQSPILRYLQIEEYLKAHLARLPKIDS